MRNFRNELSATPKIHDHVMHNREIARLDCAVPNGNRTAAEPVRAQSFGRNSTTFALPQLIIYDK
jgi:hypothetical protein